MFRSGRPTARPRHRTHARLATSGLLAVFALVGGTLSTATAADSRRATPAAGHISYFFVSSLHSRPWRIAPGPDGNLWFTNTDSDTVNKITVDGTITQYPIGDGKFPYDIVAGRDGNLWFTENVNNKAGAVDTDGTLVHEYYAPGVDARPTGITVAPGGEVWWVDGGAGTDPESNVSRLTKDGDVINYELFPCACFGIGITTGPDGNLWAVEELGVSGEEARGTIDRIAHKGKRIKRFPIPAPPFTDQHLPAWDAAGPDGRVWFTELSRVYHDVGAITPDGTVSLYPLPGDSSNTGSVTTGIDGRIWVTEPDANRITVLNPDGSFFKSISVHQLPMGITIGPDGNMWFTNALSGEIGRIQTARPGVGYVLDIAPGFVPAERTISLGDRVQWVLEAPGVHTVRDTTGLGLYSSGPRSPVSFFRHTFTAAGSYGYEDTQNGDAGSIGVPVNAPATGTIGSPIHVTWSTDAPAPGLVFDAQYLPPGSGTWVSWKTGVVTKAGSLLPTGIGTYQFRAHVRDGVSGDASDWSPPVSVVVS
jgi:virginiamycin B lyase